MKYHKKWFRKWIMIQTVGLNRCLSKIKFARTYEIESYYDYEQNCLKHGHAYPFNRPVSRFLKTKAIHYIFCFINFSTLLDQLVVGPVGRRTSGPSDYWIVGILGVTKFYWHFQFSFQCWVTICWLLSWCGYTLKLRLTNKLPLDNSK